MTYQITWEERGVYKRFWGFVSFQEYSRTQELVLGDARADDIRYIINDLLDVEGYTVTTDQAEYLAAFNRGSSFSNPRIRIAYVTHDPKLVWLMKAAAVFSAYSLKDFPTLEAAREWVAKEA
ncbi:MAG: STAS/SEC14 domain-containing protein [Sulfuritalea sp.]|nr:STAS/SEC14 domain-containing protein [Sulfuritalea sp.]